MKIGMTSQNSFIGNCFQTMYKDFYYKVFSGKIENQKDVFEFCEEIRGFDVLLHFAAKVSRNSVDKSPSEAHAVNSLGTLNVLEGLQILGEKAPKLFFPSSSHVYEPSLKPCGEQSRLLPRTFYGLTKLQSEQLCTFFAYKYNLKIIIGRIFNIYGLQQSSNFFIPSIVRKIINCPPNSVIEIESGDSFRDFIHIDQVCAAIKHLVSSDFEGIVNIGTGLGLNLTSIANSIKTITNRQDIEVHSDKTFENLVADISKLNSLGFIGKNFFDKNLLEIIQNTKVDL
jgi:UDP-glucose 4-epimerase